MKNNQIGTLSYHYTSSRWCLIFGEDCIELHCGDCFQIEINKRWEIVRIEMGMNNNDWYLVTSIGNIDIPNSLCRVKEIK